ncbi:hypothetical protein [Phytoactinopolyspora mesophila]|uniref:hypothetical protein n=1 Tax=Phytoactinopolyspora mesophila TaxID=2650750 RepID=UPI0016520F82|nr:hypothetical protein [Phytoactinopolyspora mesophila]
MNTDRESIHPVIAAYTHAVVEQLGDLDPEELSEMTADLGEHLAAVGAELGEGLSWETLTARLGTPVQYAAELRAAAGMADLSARSPRAGTIRRAVRFLAAVAATSAVVCAVVGVAGILFVGPETAGWLALSLISSIAAVACVMALVLGAEDRDAELRGIPGSAHVLRAERWLGQQPWGEPALEYTRSLRPAWWAARAAALGAAVGYASTMSLGLAVFLVGVVGSVWLGLRTSRQPLLGGRRVALGVVNTVAVVLGAVALSSAVDSDRTTVVEYVSYADDEWDEGHGGWDEEHPVDDVSEPAVAPDDEWSQGGDGQVTNIFPYGPDGELLTGVRLFDQDGTPVEVPWIACDDDARGVDFTVPSPWGAHVYPRLSGSDDEGECGQPELRAPFGEQLPDLEPTGSEVEDK